MKSKIISKILRITGIILIVLSLILTGYNLIENAIAKNKSSIVLDKLYTIQNNNEDEENINNGTYVDDNGIEYIGTITLEKLNITLPVISSFKDEYLKIAPNLYSGSIVTNDAVIIAHNYMSHFGAIDKLNTDDIVIFKDLENKEYRYRVASKESINEKDITKLYVGQWDLTLFTCKNVDMTFRTVIRLNKIEE